MKLLSYKTQISKATYADEIHFEKTLLKFLFSDVSQRDLYSASLHLNLTNSIQNILSRNADDGGSDSDSESDSDSDNEDFGIKPNESFVEIGSYKYYQIAYRFPCKLLVPDIMNICRYLSYSAIFTQSQVDELTQAFKNYFGLKAAYKETNFLFFGKAERKDQVEDKQRILNSK